MTHTLSRRGLVLALLVALAVPLVAQTRTYESITVAGTAIGLGTTTLDPANAAPILGCTARLETAQVRFRLDGTAPTASEGTLMEVGDVLDIRGYQDAKAIQWIRTGAVSGVIKVFCER